MLSGLLIQERSDVFLYRGVIRVEQGDAFQLDVASGAVASNENLVRILT